MKRSRAAESAPPASGRQQKLAAFFGKPSTLHGAAEEAVPAAAPARAPAPVAAWGAIVVSQPHAAHALPRARAAWGGRFYACPFSDVRHPSAGCGALDAIRGNGRAMQGAPPAAAAAGPDGHQRRNLATVLRVALEARPVRAALREADAALAAAALGLPPCAQALLAALYYAPHDGWHRLTAAPGARAPAAAAPSFAPLCGEGGAALASLLAAGLALDAAAPAALPALLALLTAAEAAALVKSGGVARGGAASPADALAAHLASGAAAAAPLRRRCLDVLGPAAALAPAAGDALLRIHRLVFVLSGFSPEEAASLLSQDMDRLRLGASRPPAAAVGVGPRIGVAQAVGCAAAALHAAAAMSDALEAAAERGDADVAYAALHEASSALLDSDSDSGVDDAARCDVAAALQAATRSQLCRVVLRGASLLEREKRHADAVHYLRALLARGGGAAAAACAACAPLRAAAALRLALDLERLGAKEDALAAAEAALGIGTTGGGGGGGVPRGASQVGLLRIVERLAVPPRRWRPPAAAPPPAAPELTLPLPRRPDGAWLLPSGGGVTPSVEAAVLTWHAQPRNGGWRGAHAENGPWVALFAHLMCHVIDDVAAAPGAWLSPLADGPLDFGHGIAQRRPAAVAARLAAIAAQSRDALCAEVHTAAAAAAAPGAPHARGAGAPCALQPADLAAVAGRLGGPACAAICSAFADGYDAATCGFPDLLMWQPAPDADVAPGAPPAPAAALRAVEVKGPGDRLSDRQRAAHALLLHAGVPITVCYVTADVEQ